MTLTPNDSTLAQTRRCLYVLQDSSQDEASRQLAEAQLESLATEADSLRLRMARLVAMLESGSDGADGYLSDMIRAACPANDPLPYLLGYDAATNEVNWLLDESQLESYTHGYRLVSLGQGLLAMTMVQGWVGDDPLSLVIPGRDAERMAVLLADMAAAAEVAHEEVSA